MRWVLPFVLAALAACSSAAPAAQTSPAPGGPADAVQEFVGEGAPLEPGRTTYSLFDPPFTFVVPEGWSGGHSHPDYFDVWNGDDLAIGFARPTAIPVPRGAVAWDSLGPRRALRLLGEIVPGVGPIGETEVDGRAALERSFSIERRTELLTFTDGAAFNVEPPWRQRAIVFDVDGTLLLILVQRTTLDEDAEASVLSSIDFDA